MPRTELIVLPDRASLSRTAADRVAEASQAAVRARGAFTVALSGGSTPRDLYGLLASEPWRGRIDWARTFVFWGDERAVPPDDPRSNYKLALDHLLSKVPIPESNVSRPLAELVPDARAALDYAADVRRVVPPGAERVPSFDLVMLGLGDDGHTASLLPGSRLVYERTELVAITDLQREGTTRLTFTPPLLWHAATLMFLVSGGDKAPALREVLHGAERVDRYPAQVVRQAHGEVLWLVDQAAAADLPSEAGRAVVG